MGKVETSLVQTHAWARPGPCKSGGSHMWGSPFVISLRNRDLRSGASSPF